MPTMPVRLLPPSQNLTDRRILRRWLWNQALYEFDPNRFGKCDHGAEDRGVLVVQEYFLTTTFACSWLNPWLTQFDSVFSTRESRSWECFKRPRVSLS